MNRAADKDRRFNFETRNVKLEIGFLKNKKQESRIKTSTMVNVFTNQNESVLPKNSPFIAPRLVSSPTETVETDVSVVVYSNHRFPSSRFLFLPKNSIQIALVLIFTVLFSCQTSEQKTTHTQTIIDGTGRTVEVNKAAQTVMALSPSMTEVLFELLPPERIVGRTDQCDYPAACLSLPKVQVYPSVNLEKVLKINPDLIISNSEITPPETAEKLTQLGIPVLLYEINSIEKLHATIREVSQLIGAKVKGEALIKEDELQIMNYKSDSLVIPKSSLSAVTLISIDPIYVYGTTSFFDELLEIAGFQNAIDSSLGSYPQVSRSMLLRLNPDYLLGYDFEALDTTFFELYPELRSMKAYQQKNIYPLDGDLAARPSPRFVELIKEMRKIRKREALK